MNWNVNCYGTKLYHYGLLQQSPASLMFSLLSINGPSHHTADNCFVCPSGASAHPNIFWKLPILSTFTEAASLCMVAVPKYTCWNLVHVLWTLKEMSRKLVCLCSTHCLAGEISDWLRKTGISIEALRSPEDCHVQAASMKCIRVGQQSRTLSESFRQTK